MDFSKNVIKKPQEPKVHKLNKPMTKMPAHSGKRVGGSPERINTLTGMKVKEEKKAGGTKTMKAGSNTQVIRKPGYIFTCDIFEMPLILSNFYFNSFRKPTKQTKEENKEEKKVIDYSKGKMIGKNTDHSKWRCKVCKFLNDVEETKCTMCKEEKQVYTDKAIFGGANTKKRTNERGIEGFKESKPITKPKEERKEEGGAKRPGASNATGFQSKVQTLGNYNYDHSSRAGEQKVGRIDETETTISKLQKIAMNSDNLDTMPWMKHIKEKRFVEELREPAKFNMMTFDREYGGVPQ